MEIVYEFCADKTARCFKKISDTANHFMCFNSHEIRGNVDNGLHVPQNFEENMPCQFDIEVEFDNFINTLNLTEQNCETVKKLSLNKKWLILQERKNSSNVFIKHPRHYIGQLNDQLNKINEIEMNRFIQESAKCLETLYTNMRTQCQSYIEEFIEADGVVSISNLLEFCHCKSFICDKVVSIALNIIKTMLNTKMGKKLIINDDTLMKLLALTSGTALGKGKLLSLQVLAGICMLDDGREKVISGFREAFAIQDDSKAQFQRLIWQMAEKCYPEKYDLSVKIASVSLVNVLLNSGDAKASIEKRLNLRKQFLELGLQTILDTFRNYDCPALHDHLDLFEMMKLEDEQSFLKELDESQFDATNPAAIAEMLKNRLKCDNSSYSMFLSIMQSLTLLPIDKDSQLIWKLCNSFVEKIVFQTVHSHAIDNVSESVANHMDELRNGVNIQVEANKCSSNQRDFITKQLSQAELSLKSIIKGVCLDNKVEIAKNGSEQNVFVTTSTQLVGQQNNVSTKMAIVHPLPAQICPSLPPIPPPLPPSLNFKSSPSAIKAAKLQPCNNLKCLNWITMPPNTQLNGSVWSDFKNNEIRQLLDLELLDKNFSTQQKNKRDSIADGGLSRYTSVLECRRVQNFQILLTKLKLPIEEIYNLIMNLDPDNNLHKDMIEQMLKFIPTKEEIHKLSEVQSMCTLNQVDQFFLLTKKIPCYEYRLRCLWISKVFKEKTSELKLFAEAITKASNILLNSRRIKKLLQIILAIGNHMNDGRHNGDAKAFHISSLANLTDVKSTLKSDYTLLHYLVECCDSKFPEIFRLKRELLATTEASKIPVEIESELATIRANQNLVEKEVKRADVDEIFKTKMSSFLQDSRKDLLTLQDIIADTNIAYKECLRTFAISIIPKPINPGDFFGIFSRFLNSLLNTRRCMQQEKENQEKRMETLSRARTNALTLSKMQRTSGANSTLQGHEQLSSDNDCQRKPFSDFEYLISALQNGKIFLSDLHRLRSSFRQNHEQSKKIRHAKQIVFETDSRER